MKGSPSLFAVSRLRRGLMVATVIAVSFGAAPVLSAAAEPIAPPASATDAKTAWLAAAEEAEAMNEQSLQAAENVAAAAAAVTAADAAVNAAAADVAAADEHRVAAQGVVDSYSVKLDAFANASFRGARLNEFSSLLTARSADDYLDSVTALDRVAGDTNQMLTAARDARTAADAAAADLDARRAQALAAQQAAVTASTDAVTAQQTLASSKGELDAKIASYRALYDQLTEQERQDALAADEARMTAEAAAIAATEAVQVAGTSAGAAASPPVSAAAAAVPTAAVAAVAAPNSAAQRAVEAALSKVGSRYVFGAAGPDSFDCSGLTSWAWKQAGVSIPRTSGEQHGMRSVPMDQLQPGDLITYYSPVHHVAMYIGNGQIVQASTESKPVYVTTVARGGPNASGHRVG